MNMLTGYIQDDKPLIPIDIGLGQNIQRLPALVDTGFTGELKIPENIARDANASITEVKNLYFANGEAIPHGVGRVHVDIERIQKEVNVFIGNGPVLIGVKLLRNFGYTLKMDFIGNVFYLERAEDRDPFHTEE